MNVRRVAWVMAAALPVVGALADGTHLLVHASGTADMSRRDCQPPYRRSLPGFWQPFLQRSLAKPVAGA